MKIGIFLASALIAFWMLGGGVMHFVSPEAFFPIVPDWLPELEVVLVSGAVEVAIGVGVILRRTRALAGLAFAALCAGFLPLHLWDFFRPDPVFEVPVEASFRIGVQFALIAIGLWLWKASGR